MPGGSSIASVIPRILLHVQVDVGDEDEEDNEVMDYPPQRNTTLSQLAYIIVEIC